MGALWDLVEAYRDTQRWPMSDSQIGKKAGASRSVAYRWRDMQQLPNPKHLRGLARVIDQPYRRVLEAALLDAGYLLEPEVDKDWGLSPMDLVTMVEQDERVRRVLDGPGSGADRASVLGELLRERVKADPPKG